MPDIATHEEVLKILTEQARAGSNHCGSCARAGPAGG